MSYTAASNVSSARTRYFGAAVLGFAFGGFFDGILLHQVLQWHHFLSLVPGDRYQDIHVQILADGLFHLAIYLIALVGLIMLWRHAGARTADGVLLGWAALGFSLWQFVDVVLVHWIVGIHRIRVGVPNPLLWDLGWLAAFGVTSLLIGIWLIVRSQPTSGNKSARGAPAISALIILSALATLRPGASSSTVVLFRSDMQPSQTFAAAAALDANILWGDPTGRILVLDLPSSMRSWQLYTQGAVLVGNVGAVGCLSWMRI
jgi:uncharacterized membrane protein